MSEIILSRGATRSDGFRFVAYEKRGEKIREKWLNPESFARVNGWKKSYDAGYRLRKHAAGQSPAQPPAGGPVLV